MIPRLLYVIGLSLELSDNAKGAADFYVKLWKEHPDSPFALMAKFKLEKR